MNFLMWSDNIFMNISAIILFILFLFLSFTFILFIISLFKKNKKIKDKEDYNLSIIIPVYNEEKNIEHCLNSLSKYVNKNTEIIIVDDGSIDNTIKLVKKYQTLLNIEILKSKHKGKSEALNKGIKKAKNELILCIDADITINNETIPNLIYPILRNKKVGASNSILLVEKPKKLIELFQEVEYYLNNAIRIAFSKVFNNSVWFLGAAACYRKSALEKVGYFKKDSLTEDMDISLEFFKAGYKIITSNDSIVYTKACSNLKELFRQRMRWYFGALQALIKNKVLIKDKSSIPIIFLFVNQFWWTFYSFIFLPIVIYQVNYWMPSNDIFWYLFRWFSLSGPFYVLIKIPKWGLSFMNIFGVLSGIITLIYSLISIKYFKGKINLKILFVLFFYFPYTIILNFTIIFGILKYIFKKKKYFI